jgi:hypothetical protein
MYYKLVVLVAFCNSVFLGRPGLPKENSLYCGTASYFTSTPFHIIDFWVVLYNFLIVLTVVLEDKPSACIGLTVKFIALNVGNCGH